MRTFTEEQNMFRDAYRKFLEAEIVPNREKWQEQGIVDREAFKKAGDQGFLMIWPDERVDLERPLFMLHVFLVNL